MSGIEPMVWREYDPQTGEGDPSTPVTATRLNQWTADLVAVSDAAEAFAAEAAESAATAQAPTNTALANMIRAGTYATRPAANTVPAGTRFYATDVQEEYRSNGSAWAVIGSGGNELAYAQITAEFASSTASAVDVPGLSVSWVAGERPVYLEFSGLMRCGSSTPLAWARMILGASTLVGVAGTTATGNASVHRAVRLTGLTPGTSYTAKLRLDLPGGTTGVSSGAINAGATNPASLRVVTA